MITLVPVVTGIISPLIVPVHSCPMGKTPVKPGAKVISVPGIAVYTLPPSAAASTAACTVTVVHQISVPPFDLDLEAGAAISSAILLVWAVGFGFRVLIQHLRSSDGSSTFEKE